MNCRHLLLLVTAFAGVIYFTSCKKEGKKTNTELLTTGSWKIFRYTSTTGGNSFDMVYPACAADDLYTFKTNNQFIIDDRTTNCFPNTPQTQASTWSFRDNESKIEFNGLIWDIEVLTPSEFTISTFMFNTTTVRIIHHR